MVDRKDIAESYRDLSKFYATISSGLLIATGLGTSLLTNSVNSSLSLAELSLQAQSMPSFNNTTSQQVSGSLMDGAIIALQGSDLAITMITATTLFAIIFASKGHYYWKKSHAILQNREVPSEKPYFYIHGLIAVICTVFIIYIFTGLLLE